MRMQADLSRLTAATGWTPSISFDGCWLKWWRGPARSEFGASVSGINFHDAPEDRPPPNLDERLA
jgi:hypothetical protein